MKHFIKTEIMEEKEKLIRYLKEYLERLKIYEEKDISLYSEGYYDGMQKAIDLIKDFK